MFAREPLRESAHRLLVRIYLADGNSFDAIRQFRLYRDLARSRLGIEPSPQMLELVHGLLRDGRGQRRPDRRRLNADGRGQDGDARGDGRVTAARYLPQRSAVD